MSRQVLVLQHVACEGLGTIEPVLAAAGLTPRYVRIHAGEPVPASVGSAAGLIVMGGPMSVYEHDELPHLKDEMRLIEAAIQAERPVLGVCLGSQLLAHVLGARVYPSGGKEVGWHRVTLTDEGASDPLWSGLPREFEGFHWHGDIFDLPPDAVPLAGSRMTPLQAFRYGQRAYGILCHLEVTGPQIAEMCRRFPRDLADAGTTAEEMERGAAAHLAELTRLGQLLFAGWAKLAV
jgi:GMP synthase (glutamine-hydrolysing)